MPGEDRPLRDRCVLVTRPPQQAHRLAQVLESRGARVLRFPLIEIAAPSNPNAAQSALAAIGESDLVIFTSANAARFASNLLPDLAARVGRCEVACVGDATGAALERAGIAVDVTPVAGTTSEALLAMVAMQDTRVAGRRIAIIKGEGGRELLAKVLDERGASIETVDVYRRQPPTRDLEAFLDSHEGGIDLVILTSGEALERFAALAGAQRVAQMPLVLPSDRVLEQAVGLGFSGPFSVPRRMSDVELANAAGRLVAALD